MAKKTCAKCGVSLAFWDGVPYEGQTICRNCMALIKSNPNMAKSILRVEELMAKSKEVKLTTTNNIDGYKVKKYINIESIEVVIGTGVFSEFTTSFQDFFGARSTGFEKKLADAKKAAMDLLKIAAVQKGGNAVIGIDLDYTEFSSNRIGIILNGTIVEIMPVLKESNPQLS
jgi:uncharacterized protein YbjQ (UPF0145 family)